MTQNLPQIDLNASPFPTDDELSFGEHGNHIDGVSSSQSIFQMGSTNHNKNSIDLNVLPSPNDDDDQPRDNTSYCQVTLKNTHAKDQGVMRYIDLNALPLLNNDEQPFDEWVDYMQDVHAGNNDVISKPMTTNESSTASNALYVASNSIIKPFDAFKRLNAHTPSSSNVCSLVDDPFSAFGPVDFSCDSDRKWWIFKLWSRFWRWLG